MGKSESGGPVCKCISGKTCRMAPLTVYDGPDIDPFASIAVGSCTDGEGIFVVFIFRNWCVCECVCVQSNKLWVGGGGVGDFSARKGHYFF